MAPRHWGGVGVREAALFPHGRYVGLRSRVGESPAAKWPPHKGKRWTLLFVAALQVGLFALTRFLTVAAPVGGVSVMEVGD